MDKQFVPCHHCHNQRAVLTPSRRPMCGRLPSNRSNSSGELPEPALHVLYEECLRARGCMAWSYMGFMCAVGRHGFIYGWRDCLATIRSGFASRSGGAHTPMGSRGADQLWRVTRNPIVGDVSPHREGLMGRSCSFGPEGWRAPCPCRQVLRTQPTTEPARPGHRPSRTPEMFRYVRRPLALFSIYRLAFCKGRRAWTIRVHILLWMNTMATKALTTRAWAGARNIRALRSRSSGLAAEWERQSPRAVWLNVVWIGVSS